MPKNTHIDLTTALEVLYQGRHLAGVPVQEHIVQEYNQWLDELDIPELTSDLEIHQGFMIPDKYLQLDPMEHIINLAPEHALDRVVQELEMFQARNLLPVLQLLIYIVDTLREHEVVWGVGRGSSVASYCLFLIGVHRIDSIKYNLDITEFLK
jgi:DNA polymerase III alpha subunit